MNTIYYWNTIQSLFLDDTLFFLLECSTLKMLILVRILIAACESIIYIYIQIQESITNCEDYFPFNLDLWHLSTEENTTWTIGPALPSLITNFCCFLEGLNLSNHLGINNFFPLSILTDKLISKGRI